MCVGCSAQELGYSVTVRQWHGPHRGGRDMAQGRQALGAGIARARRPTLITRSSQKRTRAAGVEVEAKEPVVAPASATAALVGPPRAKVPPSPGSRVSRRRRTCHVTHCVTPRHTAPRHPAPRHRRPSYGCRGYKAHLGLVQVQVRVENLRLGV